MIKTVVFLLGMTVLGASSVHASQNQADQVPAKLRAMILCSTLAYDRNLKSRSVDKIRIAVIYPAGSADGIDLVNELKAKSKKTIKGLPFQVIPISGQDETQITKKLAATNANALYLDGQLHHLVEPIVAYANQAKIVSFTNTRSGVQSGLGIGIVKQDNQPRLLFNTRALTRQGVDMDFRVLKLGELVQ